MTTKEYLLEICKRLQAEPGALISYKDLIDSLEFEVWSDNTDDCV